MSAFRHVTSALIVIVLASGTCFGQNGPSAREVDQSIIRALRYLSSGQSNSGAWQIRGRDSCSATSLAIMSFMAAGHVPGEGPYGRQMERGVRWVLDHQDARTGLFMHRAGSGPMYSHGIATLMLAEVAGMLEPTLDSRVRTGLERAILVILKAQAVPKGPNHAGGWRYHAGSSDSDLSVTGWQLLALRAAKNIGCDVPAESIELAVRYVRNCAYPRGGGFSYQPGQGATPTRTGTGILCLEICGEHKAPETLAAADYLLRRPLKQDDSFFYYGVYYCTVGMFQVGDRYWEFTRDQVSRMLLRLQEADGSWPGRNNESAFGSVYPTAMSVLALAVEYQYLPIYQK